MQSRSLSPSQQSDTPSESESAYSYSEASISSASNGQDIVIEQEEPKKSNQRKLSTQDVVVQRGDKKQQQTQQQPKHDVRHVRKEGPKRKPDKPAAVAAVVQPSNVEGPKKRHRHQKDDSSTVQQAQPQPQPDLNKEKLEQALSELERYKRKNKELVRKLHEARRAADAASTAAAEAIQSAQNRINAVNAQMQAQVQAQAQAQAQAQVAIKEKSDKLQRGEKRKKPSDDLPTYEESLSDPVIARGEDLEPPLKRRTKPEPTTVPITRDTKPQEVILSRSTAGTQSASLKKAPVESTPLPPSALRQVPPNPLARTEEISKIRTEPLKARVIEPLKVEPLRVRVTEPEQREKKAHVEILEPLRTDNVIFRTEATSRFDSKSEHVITRTSDRLVHVPDTQRPDHVVHKVHTRAEQQQQETRQTQRLNADTLPNFRIDIGPSSSAANTTKVTSSDNQQRRFQVTRRAEPSR